jgi:hypothetical protein
VKPGTITLHSGGDDVVPFSDSVELVRNSGLPQSALVVVGHEHRLADPESLARMLGACERTVAIQKGEGYICGTCGKFHAELPMEFGTDAPLLFYSIPANERESRCNLTSDLCNVDEHFFIRGCLEIPVVDGDGPFVWGIWASLSRENLGIPAFGCMELWVYLGLCPRPRDFVRHNSDVQRVDGKRECPASMGSQGTGAFGTSSARISLAGLLPSRAQLRFSER